MNLIAIARNTAYNVKQKMLGIGIGRVKAFVPIAVKHFPSLTPEDKNSAASNVGMRQIESSLYGNAKFVGFNLSQNTVGKNVVHDNALEKLPILAENGNLKSVQFVGSNMIASIVLAPAHFNALGLLENRKCSFRRFIASAVANLLGTGIGLANTVQRHAETPHWGQSNLPETVTSKSRPRTAGFWSIATLWSKCLAGNFKKLSWCIIRTVSEMITALKILSSGQQARKTRRGSVLSIG